MKRPPYRIKFPFRAFVDFAALRGCRLPSTRTYGAQPTTAPPYRSVNRLVTGAPRTRGASLWIPRSHWFKYQEPFLVSDFPLCLRLTAVLLASGHRLAVEVALVATAVPVTRDRGAIEFHQNPLNGRTSCVQLSSDLRNKRKHNEN